jgi:hypothetical protein
MTPTLIRLLYTTSSNIQKEPFTLFYEKYRSKLYASREHSTMPKDKKLIDCEILHTSEIHIAKKFVKKRLVNNG